MWGPAFRPGHGAGAEGPVTHTRTIRPPTPPSLLDDLADHASDEAGIVELDPMTRGRNPEMAAGGREPRERPVFLQLSVALIAAGDHDKRDIGEHAQTGHETCRLP